jgi:hypothetical protein
MTEYVSAATVLEEMCRESPVAPRKRRGGKVDIAGAVGSALLAAVVGYVAKPYMEPTMAFVWEATVLQPMYALSTDNSLSREYTMAPETASETMDNTTFAIGGATSLLEFFLLCCTAVFLGSGISALGDVRRKKEGVGVTDMAYSRYGGWTNTPTWGDRIFGTAIYPIDHARRLTRTVPGSHMEVRYGILNGATIVGCWTTQYDGVKIPVNSRTKRRDMTLRIEWKGEEYSILPGRSPPPSTYGSLGGYLERYDTMLTRAVCILGEFDDKGEFLHGNVHLAVERS